MIRSRSAASRRRSARCSMRIPPRATSTSTGTSSPRPRAGGSAEKARQVFKAAPATRDINFDWNELAKTVRLEVDQNKARALGVDSQLLGKTLQTLLPGVTATQYRERTESIDVVARAVAPERLSVEGLEAINLRTG